LNKQTTKAVSVRTDLFSKIRDYGILMKFKLTLLVVFTSILGYCIAAAGSLNIEIALLLGIGGLLVSGAANALNQVLERDFDILMDRTVDRPLVQKRMTVNEAVLIAGLCSVVGISALAIINPLTGLLAMISLLVYAFVYTPLKRHSTIAVAVGAIPGALPVLIGCTAASGTLTMLGLLLFAVQFLWQFPHFWAIGYVSKDDYDKAGFKLLPIEDGKIDRKLGLHASIYAAILVVTSFMLFYVPSLSVIAVAICIIFSVAYLIFSINFHIKFDRKSALQLMFSSFFYLPLVLLILLGL